MPRSGKATIDGILNIDKPYGITSMDVVRRIKRASRQRRVGHGGTLDPIATGVIPVCLGQATRLMEDVVGGAKSYLASIELGVNHRHLRRARRGCGAARLFRHNARRHRRRAARIHGRHPAGAAHVQRAKAGRQEAVRSRARRR